MFAMSVFAALSVATSLLLVPALAWAGEDVAFDALPAAVKATVQREVGSGRISEIERDLERGRVVYEVEFWQGDVEREIEVAEDGTLVARH
jgi:hypothetical protein